MCAGMKRPEMLVGADVAAPCAVRRAAGHAHGQGVRADAVGAGPLRGVAGNDDSVDPTMICRFGDVSAGGAPTGAALTAAALDHHHRSGKSGGNGSLVRPEPVALAYLYWESRRVGCAHRQPRR